MPAIRREALGTIFGEGETGRRGERDMVVIIKIYQLPQLQVSSKRGGFSCHTLHQIAIADNPVGVMIADLEPGSIVAGGKIRFGNRHAYTVAKSLTKRPRGGFHAREHTALGMTGRHAAPLAKLFDM